MTVRTHLTTQSGQAYSAANGSNTFQTLSFANSNGISFSTGTQGLYGTVRTDYQPAGAYLTTAALSQDSSKYAGTNGAITGGSITMNTSGVSINLPAYLTTAQPVGAYLTTARASNDAIGLNTALTANGVSMTANSSGLSLNFPAFLTTAQPIGAYLTTAMLSNAGSNFVGLNSAITANGVSMTNNSSGLSLNFPAFLTTAMQSASSSNFAKTGFTTTSVAGAVVAGTMDTNGLKIAIPAYLTTAQAPGAYLTTARASNDAIGLNTAVSNATITANSSGISFDGRGYAGTNTTFAGTNISASATMNSNGLNLALSVAAPGAGGAGVAISAGGSNFTSGTVSFGNSNGVSFITTGGSVVMSVATAPAGSLIFANANGVSFSTAVVGASTTVSASVGLNATVSKTYFMPFGAVSSSQQTNSQVSFRYLLVEQDISFTRIDIPMNLSLASSAAANTGNIVFTSGAVLYTRNGAILSPIVGVTGNTTYTWASNTANYSSIIGGRFASFGLATALTPGEYWLAVKISTTNNSSIGTATTLLANTISMMIGSYLTAQNFAEFGAVTSASTTGLFNMQGLCSVNLTNTTQTYQQSQISVSGAPGARANIQAIFRNY